MALPYRSGSRNQSNHSDAVGIERQTVGKIEEIRIDAY